MYFLCSVRESMLCRSEKGRNPISLKIIALRLRARRACSLDLRAREVLCGGYIGHAGRKAT